MGRTNICFRLFRLDVTQIAKTKKRTSFSKHSVQQMLDIFSDCSRIVLHNIWHIIPEFKKHGFFFILRE